MTPAEALTTPIADVLAANASAARVLLERRMSCGGCPFAPFETVSDVAAVYGVDPSDLAEALTGAGMSHEEPEQ